MKKSLSDLSETDPYIHKGTPIGVLSELLNAFVRSPRQPGMSEIGLVYDALMASLPEVLSKAGSNTPFKARAMRELVMAARAFADDLIGPV